MSIKEDLKEEFSNLTTQFNTILGLSKQEKYNFVELMMKYQNWYSLSIKTLNYFGKDRLNEFTGYYEPSPKRAVNFSDKEYTIKDFFSKTDPYVLKVGKNFNRENSFRLSLINQYSILNSISERIDSILNDLESNLILEFHELEVKNSKELLKINVRASGVLCGVILENHLKKVCEDNNISFHKKNNTLSDYSELLKSNSIITNTTWKKILFLSDVRNLCSHKKNEEPTKEQVQELIDGTDWVIKNV
ncbi:DUF4145 domain-containing protein [Myroides odoratimimus]|uniref:DUF4145 domain-containing protein n=1 Tax=Myroides odoratimimus TaxID=76832 RepID=UPI003D2F69E3